MRILLILIFCLHTFPAFSKPSSGESKRKAGWRESYGGDATVSEFQNIAMDIFLVLKENSIKEIDNETLTSMQSNIETALIACGENLVIDGVKKDAINFPLEKPGRIILDCEKWNSLNYSPANKVRLVAHEYLFLVGIDDSDYEISSKVVRHFFQYKNTSSTSGKFLLNVIRACDVATFHQMVQEGVDIRYRNTNGMDPIHASFAFECWSIANELIDMGVVPTSSSYAQTNSIAILIQKAANNYYSYNANIYYSFNHKDYLTIIKILKRLTDLYPYLKKEIFVETPAEGKEDKLIFNNEFEKCENKNMLIMVAQGFKIVRTSIGIGNIIQEPVYMGKDFIDDLVNMGFSQDDMDTCGRSARMIYNENK